MNEKPTILIAGSVVGQEETIEPGEITGRLTDSISSQPLPYATVALFKQGLIPFLK